MAIDPCLATWEVRSLAESEHGTMMTGMAHYCAKELADHGASHQCPCDVKKRGMWVGVKP